MEERLRSSYNKIKELITEEPTTTKFLMGIKEEFSEDIGSVRRLECIHTAADLIDCLERRDVISEYNINPFKILPNNVYYDDDIHDLLASHPVVSESPLSNKYAEQRLWEETEHKQIAVTSATPLKLENTSPSNQQEIFIGKKREAVYKLIAKEIGSSWRSLGRELGISEGDMDGIEVQHPRDLKSRVFKLFNLFEEDYRHDPKNHVFILCRALDQSRRKDIRRGVEAILCR